MATSEPSVTSKGRRWAPWRHRACGESEWLSFSRLTKPSVQMTHLIIFRATTINCWMENNIILQQVNEWVNELMNITHIIISTLILLFFFKSLKWIKALQQLLALYRLKKCMRLAEKHCFGCASAQLFCADECGSSSFCFYNRWLPGGFSF